MHERVLRSPDTTNEQPNEGPRFRRTAGLIDPRG